MAGEKTEKESAQPSNDVQISFVDITQSAGITFEHYNGAFGKKYMPETMGAGCAIFDFNNDNHQDLLFINGKDWPGRDSEKSHAPALYKNLRNGKFQEVTKGAGLAREMYGMGCGIADYDNDGFNDIYMLNLGKNYLFKNNGDGTFTDVTDRAGLGLEDWSSSCAWIDYDKDGFLDLFVGNYVVWSIENDIWCTLDGVHKSYCTPESYQGVSPRLYRNNGDGTFADVTEKAGIYNPDAKTLGNVVFDFNEDGWLDISVANDTQPDYLYQNNGEGAFVEVGVMSGMAFSEMGKARAGMGMDVADYENRGLLSLIVGNFSNEMVGVYHNEGNGLFTDFAPRTNIGLESLPYLTFGLFFFDYDLDGFEDIFGANGHVEDQIATVQKSITYAQRPLLFKNRGDGTFTEVGQRIGGPLTQPVVGRGAAYGDLDNDGDLDVVITTNNGRPYVLRNDGGATNNWIRFKLKGTKSNRDGIGAKVKVYVSNSVQYKLLKAGNSYCSQSELVLTFGLGEAKQADLVEVIWPSDHRESIRNLKSGKTYLLVEGQGVQE
ncbi:MAG: CRTAC1 family protein [Phycisphaerae bacterium]|nr:CRTAC1 family protein [Phycisphaerae bacterium]